MWKQVSNLDFYFNVRDLWTGIRTSGSDVSMSEINYYGYEDGYEVLGHRRDLFIEPSTTPRNSDSTHLF